MTWPKSDSGRGELTHPASIDLPTTTFYTVISADGFDYNVNGPFSVETAPSELFVRLQALPTKSGRVTAEGQPVVGARVELFGLASDEHTIKSHGFPVRTATSTTFDTRTDGEGKYQLTVRTSNEYVIRAEAPGWAAAEIGPLELDASSSLDDLDLELTRGGRDRGASPLAAGRRPDRLGHWRVAR